MTEFNFTSNDGVVNVSIYTDLIGIDKGSENCTVHEIRHRGSNVTTSKAQFVNWAKLPTSKTALVVFAKAQNLNLTARIEGPKTPVAPLVLNTQS